MAPGPLLLTFALLTAGLAGLDAAAADIVTSLWRQQPVVIDGLNDEWQQGLLRLEDTPASLGVMNDGESVFLAIAVSDQAQRRRLLLTGLDIWFDKDGGKKKRFGIQIPRAAFGRADMGVPPEPGGPPPARTDAGNAANRRLPELTYVYFLGPEENQRRRVELSELAGVAAARELSEGTLIIELKVPLGLVGAAGTMPAYGIGAVVGKKIGIGLESPKVERPAMAQAGGGRRGPGGAGGGGGWSGGAGGMRQGGGMGRGGTGGRGTDAAGGRAGTGDSGKPLHVWTSVLLAGAR